MATSKEKLQIIINAQGIAKTKAQLKAMDKASGGATKSFGAMAVGIAGATVALYALGKATSFAIRVGKEFEQGMANVKAISGATGAEFSALEKNARKLGATTKFTATEVAGLQTEFAKLGFTTTEINKVTKGTLALAAATGADLAIAAETAGATLRGFGLDASQTGRVTDIMAKSFSRSALDMSKFSDSMKFVAPVAKMAGFSIEGTTAILGQLANAGLHGSMAGTALRSIFLKLADTNSTLSKRLGGSVNSVEELIPALNKLKDEGVDLTEMLQLTDKRAVTAFGVLLDGVDDVNILTESLRNAGGAAQEMADIQLDTLEGKLTILKSATEGLGISIFQSMGPALESSVEWLTGAASAASSFFRGLTETSLETTIRELDELGASSESLMKLQNIQLERNLVKLNHELKFSADHFKDIDILQDQINENMKETTYLATLNAGSELESIKLQEEYETLLAKRLPMIRQEGEFADMEVGKLNEMIDANTILMDQNAQKKEDMEDDLANAEQRIIQLGTESENLDENLQILLDIKKTEAEIIALKGISIDKDGEDGKDGPLDPAKILGIPTEEEAARALEMLQQYQFSTLDIKEQASIQELESIKATKEQILAVEKFYDQQRWKSALNTTGKLLGAMGQLNSASKGSALVTARLQQGAIIANTASAAMAAITPPTGAPTPLGYANMAAVIITGLAQGVQIEQGLSQIKAAQTGMNEIVSSPTLIMAGEAGREQVSITPLEGPNIDGPQGGGSITVNVSGNVLTEDFVSGELAENIKEAIRRGTDFGIS